ncbi:MAG: UDP-N-acetylglucosamine 2-epimerase (hydrolyzing) [Chlorobium sp.]|jgi:GDP/UDP-N,N'-diacetylbacillosamine 2-epimerase (hydrolysing)|nr:UDP-N-acetylglucosamine 2-epimerase (hydrolyzing) [Chlorobium sp.]
MKRIAILTSSRADYSIYLPLLKEMGKDSFFKVQIIAFGTHLSQFHGYTIDQIDNDGFIPSFQIESILAGDSANAIATSMALTSLKFADFWKENKTKFDLVLCLGDRYEMFASIIAGIPFNIQFAHLHGGERTLGAIDNIFRHSITLASKYHFVSCKEHGERVAELTESKENIFDVGALSLDNINSLPLLSKDDFFSRFGLDLNLPTILVTVHPETVSPEMNQMYVEELAGTLLELEKYQVIITLPNTDTNSAQIRARLLQLPFKSLDRILCFENLGSQGYFTALKYCSFLLGNTSSGIIEAASFGRWVINIGDRQKGRKQSQNILNVPFKRSLILQAVLEIEKAPVYSGENIYYKGYAAKNICSILKRIL